MSYEYQKALGTKTIPASSAVLATEFSARRCGVLLAVSSDGSVDVASLQPGLYAQSQAATVYGLSSLFSIKGAVKSVVPYEDDSRQADIWIRNTGTSPVTVDLFELVG